MCCTVMISYKHFTIPTLQKLANSYRHLHHVSHRTRTGLPFLLFVTELSSPAEMGTSCGGNKVIDFFNYYYYYEEEEDEKEEDVVLSPLFQFLNKL